MIDIDKITRKSQLAKDLVKHGIAENFEDASQKIDDQELVRGSTENKAVSPEIKVKDAASHKRLDVPPRIMAVKREEPELNQKPMQSPSNPIQNQQGDDLLLRRVNMLEMQLNQLKGQLLEKTNAHESNLREVKTSLSLLQNSLNDVKSAQKTENNAPASVSIQQTAPADVPPVQKSEEQPHNPRMPVEMDGFDPSVENIFNNSGDRILGKAEKK